MRTSNVALSLIFLAHQAVPSDTSFSAGSRPFTFTQRNPAPSQYTKANAPTKMVIRCPVSLKSSRNPLADLIERASTIIWKGALFGDLTEEEQGAKRNTEFVKDEQTRAFTGSVTRVAARSFREDGASKPSSQFYTTRKDALPQIMLLDAGVSGDYNHYRTQALKSTQDRAVSIVTADVMQSLQAEQRFRVAKDGDLGENILVGGVGFRFFEVGRRYLFGAAGDDSDEHYEEEETNNGRGVVVEITEPMIPCANLCKLPYINNSDLMPSERIQRCQSLLEWLGRADGFRGWYAKVIVEGEVRLGDRVTAIG